MPQPQPKPHLNLVTPAEDLRATLARDACVARAIEMMNADPARRWTVQSLAKAVGLSRSPFAHRFRKATGTSPLRFLAALRMRLARQRLETTDDGLAAIGAYVGYESEFAFGKAFKRRVGLAPGVYRRQMRNPSIMTPRMQVRAAA